jgi:hypothetical protein
MEELMYFFAMNAGLIAVIKMVFFLVIGVQQQKQFEISLTQEWTITKRKKPTSLEKKTKWKRFCLDFL